MPTLNWIGKDNVVTHHQEVPFHVLEHKYGFSAADGQSDSFTGSGNMIIHGDNLVALKSLLPKYEGCVDCIYIDPPYNTGEEKWIYNDNVNDPHIQKWLGDVVGKEEEDLSRHDKWICMMYPRLSLLQRMLSFDGVLAISIGYHELNSLFWLCKKIFPTKQVVITTVQTSGGKPSEGFNYMQEYIVFVAPRGFSPNPSKAAMNEYSSPYHAMTLAGFNQEERPNQVYPIYINKNTGAFDHVGKSLQELIVEGKYTGEKIDFPFDYSAPDGMAVVWPVTKKGDKCVWRLTPTSFVDNWNKGYVKLSPLTSSNNENIYSVQYLADGIISKIESGEMETYRISDDPQIKTLEVADFKTGGVNIQTIWTNKQYYTARGSSELTNIFSEKGRFPYPKPLQLVKDILQRITKPNSIVLDSFGGSGTTANAVLSLNNDDNGNRKFILIEMMEYADTITSERIKRVIKGYSFKGKKEEEIYSKKLTPQNILNAEELLEEARVAAETNKEEFEKISKPQIVDNCLKVIGTKVYDGQMPGLGGSFDYYELGLPLFDEKGFLNENIDIKKIREYIYYSETQCPLVDNELYYDSYLLGKYNYTDYYFYYEPKVETTFGPDTLNIIVRKADSYIVYADICLFSKEELVRMNIVFKKIPRDIYRF